MGDIATLVKHRADSYTLDEYIDWVRQIGAWPLQQTWQPNREEIETDYGGIVRTIYSANPIVFACIVKRFQLFSQARIQFQQMRGGQPGDLFGTPDLAIVEKPEPGMATPDLLGRALLDADLAGDWFGVRRPNRIKRLRPDWTVVIIGSPNVDFETPADDPDAEVIGYQYFPGGIHNPTSRPWNLLREEVAHFFPIPDPISKYRGMPIITAAVREIRADSLATSHKAAFFEHAATPNLVIKFPPGLPKDKATDWINLFEQEHAGALNAYRTAYLGAGGDAMVVGRDLQQMDFSATVGKGETRIVSALGLHPTIVPVSEGLQGASLNAGNFAAARRLVADTTLRSNWGNFVASLETILPPLSGTRLWYDERHIPFLAEDVMDAAEVVSRNMLSIEAGVRAGFRPETIVDAVTSGDLRRLVHTGLYSVQLQPPNSGTPDTFAAFAAAFFEEQRRALTPRLTAGPTSQVVALATFWPSSSDLSPAVIPKGALVPVSDPIVPRYPSLFGRAEGVAA